MVGYMPLTIIGLFEMRNQKVAKIIKIQGKMSGFKFWKKKAKHNGSVILHMHESENMQEK